MLICFTLGLFVVLAFVLWPDTAQKHTPQTPGSGHIFLISIDTLRADHLGCYGYKRNTTPNIDSFAKDAVIFKNSIAQAPYTLASHASMLTSLIPSHHGAVRLDTELPDEILTAGEIFKNLGYRTVSFNGGGQVSGKYALDQGFDVYQIIKQPEEASDNSFKTKVVAAIEQLRHYPDRTFFFFLHTYEVHSPYTPKKEYLALFEQNYSGRLPAHETPNSILKHINIKKIEMSEQDKQHIINTYDAEIYSMDNSFGMFIDFLKKNNLYDDAMIIFTSDHGEEFGERGLMGRHHYTLYDELLKVPLIIKFPKFKYAGRMIHEQAAGIDILPTILDVYNVPIPDDFEGVSLLACLNDDGTTTPYTISQRSGGKDTIYDCIRTNKYKLYGRLLFDLEQDPGELTDIASEQVEVCAELQKELDFTLQTRTTPQTKQAQLDEETLKGLRALGYVE